MNIAFPNTAYEGLVRYQYRLRCPAEDEVQCACVSLASLEIIVTRDAAGFSASPVIALTPPELLARLDLGM
jgi:hypothetical protein